jgi:hypothetical protein
MAPRDRVRIERDAAVGLSTQHVFARSQWNPSTILQQPTEGGRINGDACRRIHGVAAEGVTKSVCRSYKLRPVRIVTQGFADLGDQAREIRFRDKDIRPQPRLQFGLGQGARTCVSMSTFNSSNAFGDR